LAATVFMSMMPSKGKKVRGINAVTEIETVSVTHQQTIQIATAITLSASSLSNSKGRLKNSRKRIGPNSRPIFFIKACKF